MKPTTGRIINYWPQTWERTIPGGTDPLAAIITHVWGDNCVNLSVFPESGGMASSLTSVRLVNHDDGPQPGQCSWMPVQQQTTAILKALGSVPDGPPPMGPDTDIDFERRRIDSIARVCHEANRAYCQALGDHSHKPWDDAPEWQRVSARMGVDLHLSGDFGPEASHVAWMKEKVDAGWVYGPVKNADAVPPTHPCIVPFDQLGVQQQAKDFIFRAVVHAMR